MCAPTLQRENYWGAKWPGKASLSPRLARWCKSVFIFSQMQSLKSPDLTLLAFSLRRSWSRLVYRSRRVECNSSKVFVYDNSPHKACGTLFSFLVARFIQKAILWNKNLLVACYESLGFYVWMEIFWLWIYFCCAALSRNDKNFYWVEFSEWMTRGLRMPGTTNERLR